MASKFRLVEVLLAAGGYASVAHVARAGVSMSEIRTARSRRLVITPHRGVVSLPGALDTTTGSLRGHLARARGAVAVRASAGAIWGIVAPPSEPAFDFRSRSDTARHASRGIAEWEIRERDGVLLTTVERTIIDLAWDLSWQALERAIERAIAAELCTSQSIAEHLGKITTRGRKGVRNLRAILNSRIDTKKSEAETRFVQALRRTSIARPQLQHPIDLPGGQRSLLDAYWPRHRVAVEIDGYRFHRSASEFRVDRRRQNAIQSLGIEVIRFTWLDLTRDLEYVMEHLAARLNARSTQPDK